MTKNAPVSREIVSRSLFLPALSPGRSALKPGKNEPGIVLIAQSFNLFLRAVKDGLPRIENRPQLMGNVAL